MATVEMGHWVVDFGIGMTSAWGRTMISVTGELDEVSIRPFASALAAALESGDAEIHLDMENVTSISAACVACLLTVQERMDAAGRSMRFVHASRDVVDALVAVDAWARFA